MCPSVEYSAVFRYRPSSLVITVRPRARCFLPDFSPDSLFTAPLMPSEAFSHRPYRQRPPQPHPIRMTTAEPQNERGGDRDHCRQRLLGNIDKIFLLLILLSIFAASTNCGVLRRKREKTLTTCFCRVRSHAYFAREGKISSYMIRAASQLFC
jgi:hypothetical protein